MKRKIPAIRDYMTWTPHTIGRDIPVPKAKTMMREYKIRHLPVLSQGKIVGVISDRNVTEGLLVKGGETFLVEDVMTPDPYIVTPETPLDDVLSEMASEKYGCAIIEDKTQKVIGVFTTVDVCRAFNTHLKETSK